jgi:hypothetical protein
MKTFQVASYRDKTIVIIEAESMAKAAAIALNVPVATKQFGDGRSWGNAKGRKCTESVSVYPMSERVPEYFTRREVA